MSCLHCEMGVVGAPTCAVVDTLGCLVGGHFGGGGDCCCCCCYGGVVVVVVDMACCCGVQLENDMVHHFDVVGG